VRNCPVAVFFTVLRGGRTGSVRQCKVLVPLAVGLFPSATFCLCTAGIRKCSGCDVFAVAALAFALAPVAMVVAIVALRVGTASDRNVAATVTVGVSCKPRCNVEAVVTEGVGEVPIAVLNAVTAGVRDLPAGKFRSPPTDDGAGAVCTRSRNPVAYCRAVVFPTDNCASAGTAKVKPRTTAMTNRTILADKIAFHEAILLKWLNN